MWFSLFLLSTSKCNIFIILHGITKDFEEQRTLLNLGIFWQPFLKSWCCCFTFLLLLFLTFSVFARCIRFPTVPFPIHQDSLYISLLYGKQLRKSPTLSYDDKFLLNSSRNIFLRNIRHCPYAGNRNILFFLISHFRG